MKTTTQQRKNDLIESLLLLKKETELIISEPKLISKINRINAGIRAYTYRCSICRHDRIKGCPSDCIFGINKSCKNYFWHPDLDTAKKKDFEIALEFLNLAIPELQSLPEFCFSESYVKSLRKVFKNLDDIFKEGFKKPPKERKPRLKQSIYNDKISI